MVPGHPCQSRPVRVPARLHVKIVAAGDPLRPMCASRINQGDAILLAITMDVGHITAVRRNHRSGDLAKLRCHRTGHSPLDRLAKQLSGGTPHKKNLTTMNGKVTTPIADLRAHVVFRGQVIRCLIDSPLGHQHTASRSLFQPDQGPTIAIPANSLQVATLSQQARCHGAIPETVSAGLVCHTILTNGTLKQRATIYLAQPPSGTVRYLKKQVTQHTRAAAAPNQHVSADGP